MSNPKYAINRVEVGKVHHNVTQEVVVITVDRLRMLITNHTNCLEKASGWQAALGVLASLVAAISTTEFKETFGVSGDVWKALFIISIMLSFIWLIRSLIRYNRLETIDKLIEKITASNET